MGLFTQSFPVTIVDVGWPKLCMIFSMNTGNFPSLYIGTSGLVLPVANKQAFPPAYRNSSRLTYYASLFTTIEINSTFYTIPMAKTFARWAAEVPDHFRFTVKLWRGITHVPGLQFDPEDVYRFLHAADTLGDKKGCLLIQFPPGLQGSAAPQLEQLLDAVSRHNPSGTWQLAVEFRHRSWYYPDANAILLRHRAGRVLHDMPSSAIAELPDHPEIPFVYLRFHGSEGDYRGGYNQTFLAAWADRIAGWLSEQKKVYVYFNNTIGDPLIDLERLIALL
jgi:uncharacterized protein YecE (DUF72 family)